MNRSSFSFEVLTPAIAGGANPKMRAEIRPASIRGQLHWWFRTLGGFKMQTGPVRSREAEIFGSVAKNDAKASRLVIRVSNPPSSTPPMTMEALGAKPFSDKGYLLWPLRRQEDARATIAPGSKFEIQVLWLGDPKLWASIQALISVFAHVGSLGFRGRRAMGALHSGSVLPFSEALSHFEKPTNITIKSINTTLSSADRSIQELGRWLKSWRAHGRTKDDPRPEQEMPGFKWAKSDHDLGANLLSRRNPGAAQIYRPAVGMPLTQRFTGGALEWKPGNQGRFASPILLRPYRTSTGVWKALVLFIHCHEWDQNKQVSPNRGVTVRVSLDLLRAMQNDPQLIEFR
jgi:CRISPR type III-B/RAMP module RAMP protein Cmr1